MTIDVGMCLAGAQVQPVMVHGQLALWLRRTGLTAWGHG